MNESMSSEETETALVASGQKAEIRISD